MASLPEHASECALRPDPSVEAVLHSHAAAIRSPSCSLQTEVTWQMHPAGQDASAEFDPIHSADARRMTLSEPPERCWAGGCTCTLEMTTRPVRDVCTIVVVCSWWEFRIQHYNTAAAQRRDARNLAANRRPNAEYLIGKVEGAEPPFKPGDRKAGKQGGQAAASSPEAEGQEGGEDEPALKKGKVLKVRRAGPAAGCVRRTPSAERQKGCARRSVPCPIMRCLDSNPTGPPD